MADQEQLDWLAWHAPYDDPDSRLSKRLRVVQRRIVEALDGSTGRIRLISMCAGQGRDLLPVLADHPRRDDVDALLVELDPRNAALASEAARGAGLDGVRVVCGDASLTDSYAGAVPAEIVMVCGVFGNIVNDDVIRTIEVLPSLCAPRATVIWTRGAERSADAASLIRGWFVERGFEEIAFDAPEDETFRVGVNRLVAEPRPFATGQRMFTFLR
jgi:hypothetical protein